MVRHVTQHRGSREWLNTRMERGNEGTPAIRPHNPPVQFPTLGNEIAVHLSSRHGGGSVTKDSRQGGLCPAGRGRRRTRVVPLSAARAFHPPRAVPLVSHEDRSSPLTDGVGRGAIAPLFIC
ncbi:unnamed protein product [Pylaiella littoralis]